MQSLSSVWYRWCSLAYRFPGPGPELLIGQVCHGFQNPAFDTSPSDASDGGVPRPHSEKHCSVRSENTLQLSCYPRSSNNPTAPTLSPRTPSRESSSKNEEKKERVGEKRKEEDERDITISSASILCLYTHSTMSRQSGYYSAHFIDVETETKNIGNFAQGHVKVEDQEFRPGAWVCIWRCCQQTLLPTRHTEQ